MSTIEGMRIPRITTFGNNEEVHIPTRTSPEGAIFDKLQHEAQNGTPLVNAGQHVLLTLPSLLPHHPEGSIVCWAGKKDSGGIQPWHNPESWIDLSNDGEFLSEVEHMAGEVVKSDNSMYFFFGWSPDNPHPKTGFTRRGGMTQMRHHSHIAPRLTQDMVSSILEVTPSLNKEEQKLLSVFLDYGSQVAHSHLPHLKDFSSVSYSWKQYDTIDRHMHGFLHLQDAVKQLVELQMKLHYSWMQIAEKLYQDHNRDYVHYFESGEQSLLLFPPVVSASVIFPSPSDKKIIGMKDNDPHTVLVSPFSPVNKVVLVDGVWLDRKSV